MLICKRADIAFVQIPKNGSKSIRQALLDSFGLDHGPVSRDLGWTEAQFDDAYARGQKSYLPALGDNNLDHITLPGYRDHLPQAYAALRAAHSFAMIREPRDRFLSALLQRLGQFRDMKAIRATDPVVVEEARHVCDWLDGKTYFHDREYIHFTRQIDYVDLDGERIITAIFPINRTDQIENWIETLTGVPISIAHEHARREPKSLGKVLYPPLRYLGKRVVSRKLRQTVYPLWRNSPLFANAANSYEKVHLGPDVEQFIARFYADDARLYEEARATSAKMQSAGAG